MSSLARRFDFQIGGKGFMLAKDPNGGRSWQRVGVSDIAGAAKSYLSQQYGNLPDELDHVEVWNDWSGGFGHPYRESLDQYDAYSGQQQNYYHWGENFDSRWPKQLIHCQQLQLHPQASGTDVCGFLNVAMAMSTNGYFGPAVAGDGTVVMIGKSGALNLTVPVDNNGFHGKTYAAGNPFYTAKPALFGSYIYLPVATATPFDYVSLAGSLYHSNTGLQARAFAVAGNQLWRAAGAPDRSFYAQNVSIGNDPTLTANWSATFAVGQGNYGITDMASLENQVYVGMGDGLYAGDQTGTFINVLPQIGNNSHPDNCRDIAVHDGTVCVQHVGGIIQYSPGVTALAREIGPPATSSRSPIRGMVRALRDYAGWLYAGLSTGSQSYILAGRKVSNYQYAWHSMYKLPAPSKVDRIHFDAVTTASSGQVRVPSRIWISTDASIDTSGTWGWWYAPIAPGDSNPLGAPGPFSANYVGSARMDLGSTDFGTPATPKVFRDVEIWADGLSSGNQWCQVYYDIDHSGSFTLLGTSAKSPKDTLYFPSGEGSFLLGQSIELSLRSFTASPGVTPVYRAMLLRGALNPRYIDNITAVVRVADNLRDRQGAVMRSGATMLKELRDLANPDANLGPHILIDLMGATENVKMVGRPQEQEVWQQGDEYPELAVTIKMATLTYS